MIKRITLMLCMTSIFLGACATSNADKSNAAICTLTPKTLIELQEKFISDFQNYLLGEDIFDEKIVEIENIEFQITPWKVVGFYGDFMVAWDVKPQKTCEVGSTVLHLVNSPLKNNEIKSGTKYQLTDFLFTGSSYKSPMNDIYLDFEGKSFSLFNPPNPYEETE